MNYILMHLSHIRNLLSIYLKIFLILLFILKIVIDCNELWLTLVSVAAWMLKF